jgi:Ca2+-transporting ATPase
VTLPNHHPWAFPGSDVAIALGSDPERGLATAEARSRLATFGRNELIERARRPAWMVLVEQFTNAMIVVLIVAAAITALIGDS